MGRLELRLRPVGLTLRAKLSGPRDNAKRGLKTLRGTPKAWRLAVARPEGFKEEEDKRGSYARGSPPPLATRYVVRHHPMPRVKPRLGA